jgi:hypothetical protein
MCPRPALERRETTVRYTASINTDVKKTFARVRRAQSKGSSQSKPGTLSKVSSIVGKVAATR